MSGIGDKSMNECPDGSITPGGNDAAMPHPAHQQRHWYAIHVRSRHEFKVADRLTEGGIENFLPVYEQTSQWKDRRKKITFALFPGYFFVRVLAEPAEMLKVLKTPGVVRFLGHTALMPESVPLVQILSLMKLVGSGEQLDPYPYLKEGQRVRIRKGMFEGVEGLLVKKQNYNRLVLSFDLLHRAVSVEIDTQDVEPV